MSIKTHATNCRQVLTTYLNSSIIYLEVRDSPDIGKDKIMNPERAIAGYLTNKIIMDFVTKEAIEKTATDIEAKTGTPMTANDIEFLMITNEEVGRRVEKYVAVGLVGCYLATQ